MNWFFEGPRNMLIGAVGLMVFLELSTLVFGGQIGLIAFFFALAGTFSFRAIFLADSIGRQGLGDGLDYWTLGLILAISGFAGSCFFTATLLLLRFLLETPAGVAFVVAFLEYWNYLIH